MIANLHSLLNQPWYINGTYGKAMLPSLFSILEGKGFSEKPHNPNIVSAYNQAGTAISVADIGSTTNTEGNVVVLGIKSPIYKYDQECGPSGTKTAMAVMEQYRNNASVTGIVLDIDSGGGQVSGTPEFHDYVAAYPKPVVAYTDGMMASAAYYIGSATKHIVANKRADAIGSIGVMCQFVDMKGYYESKGAKVRSMYSTLSPDKNKAFRDLDENDDEEGFIKTELDPIAESFHVDMKAARPNLNSVVLGGGDYDAKKALEFNLIDEIGTLNTAVAKVFELSKSSNTTNLNKTQTMNRPNLQAVIGIDAPLEAMDGHSSLAVENLDAIEATLTDNAQAIADAKKAKKDAEETLAANITANNELTAQLDAVITASEIEVPETATSEEKINAIQAHIVELGKRDAAQPTAVVVEEHENTSATLNVGGINVESYLNN